MNILLLCWRLLSISTASKFLGWNKKMKKFYDLFNNRRLALRLVSHDALLRFEVLWRILRLGFEFYLGLELPWLARGRCVRPWRTPPIWCVDSDPKDSNRSCSGYPKKKRRLALSADSSASFHRMDFSIKLALSSVLRVRTLNERSSLFNRTGLSFHFSFYTKTIRFASCRKHLPWPFFFFFWGTGLTIFPPSSGNLYSFKTTIFYPLPP